MEMQICATYFICDELTKQAGIRDDCQSKTTTAEILTIAIVAAQLFCGNQERARNFLRTYGHIPSVVSKSRFNRRLRSIPDKVWSLIFQYLSEMHRDANPTGEFAVDSFPVSVCQNIRIFRSKIYSGEEFRGYIASKKVYFYGLKVHMIVTLSGGPTEFVIAPGSESDVKIFKQMHLNLPEGSVLYADKAYNDYTHEDLAREGAEIRIVVQRKENSKRKMSAALEYLMSSGRKRVETAFSGITQLFPKSIHAVISKGFEIKLISFILAYSMAPFVS